MGSRWLLLAVSAVILAQGSASSDEWLVFKQRFGRVYTPEEEHFRQKVFAENLDRIRQHNAEFDAGRSTFRLGVNRFADLTNEEFRLKFLSQLKPATRPARAGSSSHNSSRSIPDSFDWRDEGVPIIIHDQGQLGDSSTMAVIPAIESGVYISGEEGLSLSRQNLVDCVDWLSTVDELEYARDHGVASETDYPTTGGVGPCRQVAPAVGVDEVHIVPQADEVALAEGLLQNPAPVVIDASHYSFQLYTSGIYSDPACANYALDHALLLIGYGTEENTDFWTLANSWGTAWGENGFIRVQRGVNMCGVASMAAYPTGVHRL